MKRLVLSCVAALVVGLSAVPYAQAAFGIEAFDLTFTNGDSSTATQAGSHPFAVTNYLRINSAMTPKYGRVPDAALKDLQVQLPAGLIGKPSAVPRCSSADFVDVDSSSGIPNCSNNSAVGVINAKVNYNSSPGLEGNYVSAPVYNLVPPPGVIQKFGFFVKTEPITLTFSLSPVPPYNVVVHVDNVAQPLPFLGSTLIVWGNPADPAHDPYRGACIGNGISPFDEIQTTGQLCSSTIAKEPFLTLPRACTGPLAVGYEADSWAAPGIWTPPAFLTMHDNSVPPQPQGLTGCGKLDFNPAFQAKPTTLAAQSATGMDFSVDIQDEGLTSPTGLAESDIKKAVVTLPEGMSTNPALAEGLNVCSEGDLARETVNSAPGAGCPNASKIGTVEIETPLLEERVDGALFVAKPYENPFGSLIAMYMVVKNPTLGVVVRQAFRVKTDPVTGRLTAVADDLPQVPVSHFRMHLREGSRSPLVTSPLCGTYRASAELIPWSGGPAITTSAAFQIVVGPGATGCPTGGTPPFRPRLNAGTVNNAAGHYSPFNLRLSRSDGEQEITNFSIKLPPGITGKLAGIPFCSDQAIAAAKARTGPQGGQEELDRPSCPSISAVGRSLVGVGVGPSLAYAPGKIYLAGPYNGSALSIVSITAGKVGPFDLGTVVVRFALKINPQTAEVFIDATGSDPIPHIIQGIPVHVRDIRAYVDKPDFVLNPTSCTRTSTASTVLGSGLDFGSASDDRPVTITSPFQAADCARLSFKPKLKLSLKGGTKRGDNPKFEAVFTPRRGDANLRRAQVTLPHSEFLDQSHIKTICTRAQFAQGAFPGEKCPVASIYGYAKAATPLLDEPVRGPVFLRSSSHNLPDLVAALHSGRIDINLVGRIDSVKGGRIRNTFEAAPDAPVSRFTLEMQGGKKGLLVNSTDICRGEHRALADFTGHNGKALESNPVLRASCGARGGKKNAR